MYNLTGKAALITGAAGKRGIGRAIAVRLAKEGANVVVNDKYVIPPREQDSAKDWRGLESVVEEIEAFGVNALAVTADLTDAEAVNKMVSKAIDRFGKIDILVNNAGVSGTRGIPVIDLQEKDWNLTLTITLNSTFLCSRSVGKQMVEKGIKGKIINISSINGKVALSGEGAYDVSKFGIIGLTQLLALELAPYEINVNAICPGAIHTDINLEHHKRMAQLEGISLEEAERRYYEPQERLIPLKRQGTTQDIANMAAFLASSEADYITGQAINVNGGLLMAV